MNEFPDTPGRQGGDRDDERMRRLLDAAVSDVEPSEALGSIHARTKVSSMQKKRSWVLGAGAAVVATAATVAAVTVLSDSTTPGGGGDAGPAATTGTSPAPGMLQYSNADVTLDLGSATNVPFSGSPFRPRVWNGTRGASAA
mgnify:CR=1 FL=1